MMSSWTAARGTKKKEVEEKDGNFSNALAYNKNKARSSED